MADRILVEPTVLTTKGGEFETIGSELERIASEAKRLVESLEAAQFWFGQAYNNLREELVESQPKFTNCIDGVRSYATYLKNTADTWRMQEQAIQSDMEDVVA